MKWGLTHKYTVSFVVFHFSVPLHLAEASIFVLWFFFFFFLRRLSLHALNFLVWGHPVCKCLHQKSRQHSFCPADFTTFDMHLKSTQLHVHTHTHTLTHTLTNTHCMLTTSHRAAHTQWDTHTEQVSQDAEHLPEPLGKAPGDVVSYSESWRHLFMPETRESTDTDAGRRRK